MAVARAARAAHTAPVPMVLDTNAYVAFKRGEPAAVELLAHARSLLVSAIVLGELRAGFALGTRVAQNESELVRFLGSPRVSIQVIDDRIATVYAAVYAQLRRRGTPITTNDLWIAAGAMAANAALFSYDAHFALVEGLSVITRLN